MDNENDSKTEFQRTHGLQRPFHFLQILSWIVYAYNIVIFYLFVPTLMSQGINIIFTVLYTILIGILAGFWYITSLINPTDDLVLISQARKGRNLTRQDLVQNQAVCRSCGSGVLLTSKHWGEWNRCVSGFDHHWKWLNTCIGSKNYYTFLALVIINEAFWFIHSIPLWIIIIGFFTGDSEMIERCENYWGTKNFVQLLVPLFISATVTIMIGIANTNLLIFHLYLKYHGVSTYDFVVSSRVPRKKRTRTRSKVASEIYLQAGESLSASPDDTKFPTLLESNPPEGDQTAINSGLVLPDNEL